MANICHNRIRIEGPVDRITALSALAFRTVDGERIFDCDGILSAEEKGYDTWTGSLKFLTEQPTVIEFTFETRWMPPHEEYDKLAADFPELTFATLGYDEGGLFAYRGTYSGGAGEEEVIGIEDEDGGKVAGAEEEIAQIIEEANRGLPEGWW